MKKSSLSLLFFCLISFFLQTITALPAMGIAKNQMLFFPTKSAHGEAFHFVIKGIQKKDDKDPYYYGVKPLSVANLEKGEWVASFIHNYHYSNEDGYNIYAWGMLHGQCKDSQTRFKSLIGQNNSEFQLDQFQESKLARLICASAKSGKNLSGIQVYQDWAKVSQAELKIWEPIFSHLARRNNLGLRWPERNLDLYSIFTGISAIRETLQTDVSLETRQTPRQSSCYGNNRVIVGAVEMYNMDHSTMMEKLDLDVLVKEKYLSLRPRCIDGGTYYGVDLAGKVIIRCPIHGDPENRIADDSKYFPPGKKAVKAADLKGPKAPSHPWRSMIKNKDLKLPTAYDLIPADCAFIHYPSYTAFRKSFDFFADWAATFGNIAGSDSTNFSLEQRLKRQLLLKTDLMTRLFADITISDIVLVCEDPFLFEGSAFAVLLKINNETLLKEKLEMTAGNFQKENPSITRSNQTIAGRKVQVFSSADFHFRSYRFKANGFQVVCNSPVLTEKIIATLDRKIPPITEFLDLHYFYEHIEKKMSIPERNFAFLSDAFIRKLISPEYKIATKRRLDCMTSAILQTHELLLNDKLNPSMECPDGGQYKIKAGEIVCPNHRSFGYLTPVSENIPEIVTVEEAESYARFVNNYNQYFSQFFDPIGFAFTTEPYFRGRLLIMPLVQNGIYSGLQGSVRREAMNPGPRLKNGVLKIGANLKTAALPRPRGFGFRTRDNKINQYINKWFTGCFWIHVADHPLLFQWDSNLLARGVLDAFGGGRPNSFSLAAPAVLSFFSPMLFALEMNDQSHFEAIIDWIKMTIEANRSPAGGFSPELSLDRLEEKGLVMHVLSLDLFALKKTFYLANRDGFLLISSKKQLLFELDKPEEGEKNALLGNFNLIIYPDNVRLMRSDLLEQRTRDQRKACLANLRNIAFVTTFHTGGNARDYYRLMFGADPLCPAGGSYSSDVPVSCSFHGTAQDGVLKPVSDFLHGIKAISIQSFIEPEGFQSEIQVFPK